MRVGLYLVRALYEDAHIMQPLDVLRLHTLGSARVMGVADKVGSLEVGKLADFVVVSPTSEIDRAPVFDPAATVVFASNAANVDAVYVGGEKLVEHGVLLRANMKKVSAEVDERVHRLQSQAVTDAGRSPCCAPQLTSRVSQ
jgi:cytosine/adenosine deaminase-related metal-dependent hydrolase